MPAQPTEAPPDPLIAVRKAVIVLVGRDSEGLSLIQFGVFLICCKDREDNTISGLAARLRVTRRIIVGAVNSLSKDGLVRRLVDPSGRRSVFVRQTDAGAALMGRIAQVAQFTRP